MLDPFVWVAAILDKLGSGLILTIKLAFLALFVKLMLVSMFTEFWLWFG
jgi:hypothetical protein